MKKAILTAVILVSGFVSAQKVDLEVKMSGFKNSTGKVKVGLYNSEKTFLKSTMLSLTSEIKNNQSIAIFKDLEIGEYAVSIYHDENENDVMDKNFMGIPKEDYASSNNAKGVMGPPKYQDAKIALKEDAKIEIALNK
jgi:uncharacterized protein (DUF2141 family)